MCYLMASLPDAELDIGHIPMAQLVEYRVVIGGS